jgi:two-component system, chemotaxis family, sensor kinase CheA
VHPVVVEAALEKQIQVKEARASAQQLVRVDASKLDMLVNLVGELVIAASGVNAIAQRGGHDDILEAASTMNRLVEEVRDSALNLRMVQIGDTFNRFQRVVRDVSRDIGKDIELVISGAETELDKMVVEKIGDPLTHLVRNAIDHGIEDRNLRVQRGKPAKGTVNLNAFHESGSIVIEVSDDGGGLNKDKILAKAIERNLVSAGQSLTDQEIYKLIFEAGFSTADVVSNISGRGVGMDVVRRNIEALRGTVEIDSELGVGTTMRIRLPLTLAIIDGFLIAVGKSSFVIPLDMVVECVDLTEADRNAMKERSYMNLRGEVLPFVYLREMFGIEDATSRRQSVVVVQYGAMRAGMVVDSLLGEFQTVIKPLGRIFEGMKGIGGSTILGSGEVALILDVPNLVQQASRVAQKELEMTA